MRFCCEFCVADRIRVLQLAVQNNYKMYLAPDFPELTVCGGFDLVSPV